MRYSIAQRTLGIRELNSPYTEARDRTDSKNLGRIGQNCEAPVDWISRA